MVVKRTYQLFVALIILGFCVAFGADLFFDSLIGADFGAAKPLIPWMVAGFVMQGMYYSVVNYMFYAEKTVYLSMATGTTAAFSCLISYVLATLFGLRGASVSFFLNNTLLFLLVWIISAKAVPMPWRLAR
jgi:O-antigen/teichoic acid export membrane protein